MICVSTQDRAAVEPAVRECFATDDALLSKWHIAAPGDLDSCVARTVKDAGAFDDTFQFHKAYAYGKLAGYWGTETSGIYLNLIFIKPEYRSSEFTNEFWTAVKQTLNSHFFTAVYAKNLPAVKFYSKSCSDKVTKKLNGEDIVVFEFHKDTKV